MVVLIIVAFVATASTTYFVNQEIQALNDSIAKATLLGAAFTLFGTVFTALYSEISSYYKAIATNAEKKFNLAYPLMGKYYVPILNAANTLARSIYETDPKNVSPPDQIHILYLTALFYGLRLKWLREDGGYLILATSKDNNTVRDAYGDAVGAYQWGWKGNCS